MRLLPQEENRLLIFLAAELARKRRARGLLLSQAEAVSLITDETLEAARDGLSYDDTTRRGYAVLGEADVLPQVAELVDRIELEARFSDGARLIVLHQPVLHDVPPAPAPDPPIAWLDGASVVSITNEGDVPVALTSHFHLFEANRRLRFDRKAAWGMRLAMPAGAKLVIEPGRTEDAHLTPIGGARVVRGHGGLVDGPLDAPGAREAALALARQRGYLGA